jgi:arsenate reductase
MLLPKLNVLFVCTGNSCRSQMAEAWARALHAGRIEAYSAGTDPRPIDPRAVEVMREAGIDIAGMRSKPVDELKDVGFDAVITVCDRAREACPALAGGTARLHVGFDDPPHLAAALPSAEALMPYRRVRDEIRAFVERLPQTLALRERPPEPAVDRDLAGVLDLLRAVDLPIAGVTDAFPAGYSVVRSGTAIIAGAGLERHGDAGLLRSVAVASEYRRLGLASRLVADRLELARSIGLDGVYLLTTTAAPFFAALGFESVPRAAVPAAVQRSTEFSAVCPATTECLVKRLRS